LVNEIILYYDTRSKKHQIDSYCCGGGDDDDDIEKTASIITKNIYYIEIYYNLFTKFRPKWFIFR